MKKIFLINVICLFVLLSIFSYAAPLPQMKPISIEGTIKTISWLPEKKVMAQPGFSGTLGKDRVFPAHYIINLTDTLVESDSNSTSPYNKYKSGEDISIIINHMQDDGYLKEGMRIKIYDYKVSGDEGGTWYSFGKIEFLK